MSFHTFKYKYCLNKKNIRLGLLNKKQKDIIHGWCTKIRVFKCIWAGHVIQMDQMHATLVWLCFWTCVRRRIVVGEIDSATTLCESQLADRRVFKRQGEK